MQRDFELIEVYKKDEVLECWLNRPEKRNALTTDMEEEWEDVLEIAQTDDDIKVVTLQGRGKVFSAGADMKEYAATFVGDQGAKATSDGKLKRPPPRSFAKRRLWPLPAVDKPMLPHSWYFRKTLIAGVHGYVGPYAQRMLAPFDFVIAAENTRFSFEQARMGSQNHPLAIYAFQLPMRVLKKLLLLGGWFDADKAAEFNLVQRVVPKEELSIEVAKYAEVASTLKIETIAAYKEGIHRMYEIAGLNGMIGISNNINAHVAGSRGDEFHGTLNETGNMGEALKKRDTDVDPNVTKV